MFEIYPNPSEKEGFSTLKWKTGLTPHTIQLLDAQGRVVFEKNDLSDLNSLQIPFLGLRAGYYFVKVREMSGMHSLPLVVD